MKKRIRILMLIGQAICLLMASAFILLFVFETGLWNFSGIDFASDTFRNVWTGLIELPFAIIGLLQAFKPRNRFMLWPCYFSIVYAGFMTYQTIMGMSVHFFFIIVMLPTLVINFGAAILLIMAVIQGFKEKRLLKGVPANA